MNRKKLAWDSELLDWAYWANLQSISAKDACWLVCGVDPNICNNDSVESKYSLSDKKIIEIQRAITQLEADIRSEKETEYNSPWDWVCWAESKGIPVPKQFHELAYKAKKESIHVHTSHQLEEISEESLAWYMKQDSWAYYEAIFLIHGFKPPGDIEGFDELRTHFPNEYLMLERGIAIGAIGKEVKQAGKKNFIDTPANWILWAKRKGYNTDYLKHFNYILEQATSETYKKNQMSEKKDQRHQEWQTQMEAMAADLIREGKKSQATKGKLARRLAQEIGENEATIERNTRKNW